MRRELDAYYVRTNEEQKQAKYERDKKRQEASALHQHYLVSTAAIPSIFQPPSFTKDADAMPAIENFIRSVNKAKIVVPNLNQNK
ncbi:IQ calmodulin-binding motif family protein [Histomonas meleagridis]|uniref:IQ calmodulin-binding motif family protein n=1 Tax=Histomonas meleagridis TaxID=135588 RepID=UPI003559D73A|nr:IQ calmodulin-binding motif family protein [Histomonas meleagridis]KAH0805475.1 IQ calmodulin-binding motif family protein [Histomonas meleagridis]